MVAATTPQPLTAKPTTASRNGMAKKDKDKAPAKKGDKTAKTGADKNGKKSAADVMFEGSSELRNTVAAIEKQFGEGSIMPLGADKLRKIEGISTGSLSLDIALGGQGIPRGRIIEVLRPRIERQDDPRPACDRRGPEGRRDRGVHRRRTCPRPQLGQEARRRPRNAAGQPARLGRRGDADHRDARSRATRST